MNTHASALITLLNKTFDEGKNRIRGARPTDIVELNGVKAISSRDLSRDLTFYADNTVLKDSIIQKDIDELLIQNKIKAEVITELKTDKVFLCYFWKDFVIVSPVQK